MDDKIYKNRSHLKLLEKYMESWKKERAKKQQQNNFTFMLYFNLTDTQTKKIFVG